MQQWKTEESRHTPRELNFGTLLKVLRNRHGIKQSEVVEKLPATWTQPMYSDIERGRTSPAFDDLEYIYQALQDSGVQFTLQDRKQFLTLAQAKLEAKRTHRVQKSPEKWDELRRKLVRIDRLPEHDDVSIHPQTSVRRLVPSTNTVRRETSHLLGRETWLDTVLTMIKGPSLKVLVVQGPPGSGKTSEIHRLANHFLQCIPRYYVVLSESTSIDLERLDPDIALELLLGDILEVVGSPYTSMPVTNSQARVRYVIECLTKADRPVAIFLDNAEQMLDEQGEITSTWRQFLTKFAQARHQAALVLATQEWPSSFLAETQLIMNTAIPPFSETEGSLLLQRLGLQDIPEDQLALVVSAIGGVPLCLEWVARLAQEPLLHDDWADFEEEASSEALLAQALEEVNLFGGPVAKRVQPLLERVVKRLSEETRTVVEELALSSVPLGAPALKMLYQHPASLKELRDASLLVAYTKRIQLLPMVAAQVRKTLTPDQIHAAEERLIQALMHWLNKGIPNTHEQGIVFTELACLLLHRHRFLAAAELVLYHGWLSSHVGQMLRLARLVQQTLVEREPRHYEGEETEIEAECGGILLHYYLAFYLGEDIDGHARAEAYKRILAFVSAGQIHVEPLMQVHLIDQIIRDLMTADRFEEAERLLNTYFLQLGPLLADDTELHATLLSKRAALYNRWSGFAKSCGLYEDVQRLRERTIAIYENCLVLLDKALQKAEEGTLWQSTLKKKQATFLNNLAYHLNLVGRFEEALQVVNACIDLKELGYAERDSLAASFGEKSQILAALGQFQEALRFDELAREEIRRCAEAGDTSSQKEQWIYKVNQARLYLFLGRVEEAQPLLEEAEPKIKETRRIFKIMAQDMLLEIKQGREQSAPTSFQLDWRWSKRYRKLSAYDAWWWWSHAGPFTTEEQDRWNHLFVSPVDEETKGQLRKLLLESRDHELEAALAEHRQVHLHYPAIEIGLVRQRIADFLALASEVDRDEPNAIVRRLYCGAIEDEVCFLSMIEATYGGDVERFWELSQRLYPLPTLEEMQYTLGRVRQIVLQGLQRKDTAEISRQVIRVLCDEVKLPFDVSVSSEVVQGVQKGLTLSSSQSSRKVSARSAKRFFETLLEECGYEGWQVTLDPNASGPRVESGLRRVFLPDRPLSLEDIKEYVSHELLGHVTRSIAGEYSLLGLLGMGTKGYMPTEEGLADYHERHVAMLHGQSFDDSGAWLGTLAVGLACGVGGNIPLTFTALFSFFEPFLLLYRLLWRDDEDMPTAKQRARRNALTRCLRTYRGVPDLERAGICLTKDVVYLRGHLLIEHAVTEDETILDRLAVGKVSLDLLPDLQELGIVAPRQVSILRKHAYDPELDNRILALEQEDVDSSQDHE